MSVDVPEMTVRTSRVIDLNLIKIRLATNLEDFPAYAYFSRFLPDDQDVDYEIYCVDVDREGIDTAPLAALTDPTFRAKRFRQGSYLLHYFGDPAYLITRDRRMYVFGRCLERTVWPYFVKHLLTIFSADQGFLHLKAAAFEQPGTGATLLCGRNGGGKTVFLAQACLNGARFLANTHVLLKDGAVHGVPSSIRVRPDECFSELITQRRLTAHLESGDYIADAQTLFGHQAVSRAALRNLVIVDHNRETPPGLDKVAPGTAEVFLDQFSWAVTTYGLKDDLLAYYRYDLERYAQVLHAMREQLRELARSARCYRANVDMLDPEQRTMVLKTLRDGG
jgi:hypothetical protein